MTYDVIVVGARLAGSATGMLLACTGFRVLVLDRASFPSDTMSSHQLQTPGVARLRRWGLLDQLQAAGVPLTRDVRFDAGGTVIEGSFLHVGGPMRCVAHGARCSTRSSWRRLGRQGPKSGSGRLSMGW